MSIPRFFVPLADVVHEGTQVPLEPAQARHLWVLRVPRGSALELVLPSGPWRADLSDLGKDHALARLVAPLQEDREAPVAIEAFVPVTAQLSLLDDLLPPLVELGVTLIAYSPLAQGLLTGKYTPQNPIRGTRGFQYRRFLGPLQPLIGCKG